MNADYLFLHLNYKAFEKYYHQNFELANFPKTILAEFGYSKEFIKSEIPNSFVYPGDVNSFADYINNDKNKSIKPRTKFINKFKRENINNKLSSSIPLIYENIFN